MKLLTLNDKNEIIETNENEQYVATVLLKQLWNKYMQVTKDIKRINYQYNYSDKQTVKITFTNGCKYIFKDVPTVHGVIDTDSILKGGE